jgi:hypothetical protein
MEAVLAAIISVLTPEQRALFTNQLNGSEAPAQPSNLHPYSASLHLLLLFYLDYVLLANKYNVPVFLQTYLSIRY